MSHSDYSCFSLPVDLSLSGSQVSPPRKSSARSVSSSTNRVTEDKSRRAETGKRNSARNSSDRPRKGRGKPSLAMSFPAKENRRPKQTNLSTSVKSSSEDPLSSFFNQPAAKSRSKVQTKTPTPSPRRLQVSRSKVDERVFSIPDSARSSDTITSTIDLDEKLRFSDLEHRKETKQNDLDYLKSYLSNVDKYKNASSDNEDDEIFSSASRSPQTSFPTQYSDNFDDDFDGQTPVNSPRPSSGDTVHKQRDVAARKIQTFYRRHSVRRQTSQAAVKRMLAQKKEEMERSLQNSLRRSQRSEEEKKIRRELKAKEAYKKAVEDLAKKREEKEKEMQAHVDEEMSIVKRRKAEAKKKRRNKKISSDKNETSNDVSDSVEQLFESPPNLPSSDFGVEEVDGPVPRTTAPDDTTPPSDATKSRTTLDDVLETIKILEEQPDQLKDTSSTKSALEEKLSWMDELQSENHSTVSKSSALALKQPEPNQLLTEAKLRSIIDYLDEVETKQEETQLEDNTQSVEQLIQAEQSATEVTSQMLKMRLDLEEKTKSVSLLQKALVQQRELSLKQSREQEKELQRHLKSQKEQYESTIQRHLTFIDQLIDDKKILNEKCEKLVHEMKNSDGKYQSKIKQLTESHNIEMKKSKEVMAAAEKIRREKWIDEKTKKIKEMTVKGLEPEIQRLILKHKEEIKKLKAIHEAELLRSDERAGQRYIRQNEELRDQLEREKEMACTKEREIARQRYEKQIEQEEVALQQQRKRLFAEVAEEKERLNNQAARQRSELDDLKAKLEDNTRLTSSTLREEYEKNMADVARRHSQEMQVLKERLEIEKQAWQENYMKKQEAFIIQKERELKEAVRRDRDKEIDLAIHRLEDDVHQQRQEMEKTCENRIKRIRDKYESEMREVEKSEQHTKEKYNSMKADFNEMESENLQLQSLCKQKEQEVTDMLKIKDKLVEERGNVSEVIRQEFADRLVITEEENKRLKTELSELRAKHRLELERINNEKDEELAEVHKRVRQAIVKKEETISQIRSQHEGACKRAEHLESLLEAQRKKLLGKKK